MADTRPLSTKTIFAQRDRDYAVREAASVLQSGGIVVIPTETVYGLAANAKNPQAIREVFRAKGRPGDNPLIVHIADKEMLPGIAQHISPTAHQLMDAFWPGPLTLVLQKHPDIPAEVTAGLPTVAVRMPQHDLALDIIRYAGMPLAAPSANTSGRPSPTSAMHAYEDLCGKVPLIIDGGPCETGVESTVLDVSGGGVPTILRPGSITAQQIRDITGEVHIHSGVPTEKTPASPGMKYRHYAPSAQVLVFSGNKKEVAETLNTRYDKYREMGSHPLILCATNSVAYYQGKNARPLGESPAQVQRSLFGALRDADADGFRVILFHYEDFMGLAVKNRICKAAGDLFPAREDTQNK